MENRSQQYQQPHQNQTTVMSFWKQYWYVAAGIVVFVLLIVAQIFRVLTPKEVPTQQNTWNGITPGYSSLDQLVEQMGEPLSSEQSSQGTTVYYKSEFPTLPNTVVADSTGTIQFIKEYIPYDENHVLAQYVQKYGQYDLELFDEQTGGSTKAYVFLDEGLVVLAHISGNAVEQKWYFTPTTEQNFLQSWGDSLTSEEGFGEAF